MPRIGDGLREAVNLGGLTIGDYYCSYPITRLSESETKRAQERAKEVKRCRLPWCNNVLAPRNLECAFHLGLGDCTAFEYKTFVVEDEAACIRKKRKTKAVFIKARRFAPIDIEAHWAELEEAAAAKKTVKEVRAEARRQRSNDRRLERPTVVKTEKQVVAKAPKPPPILRRVPIEPPKLVERVNLLTMRKKRGKR